MNIFKVIRDMLVKEVDEKASLSPINKSVLIENIQDNIKSLATTLSVLQDLSFDKNKLLLSYNSKIQLNATEIKKSISQAALDIPNIVAKGLSKSKMYEDKGYLNSVVFVLGVFIDVNKKLLKEIDDIIQEKSIVLKKVRVTDSYCLSLIRISDFYSTYANNLISLIVSVINGTYSIYPKYRQGYTIKHYGAFINITNSICHSPNNVFMMRDIKKIKESGMNFQLYEEGSQSVSPSSIPNGVMFGISSSFMLFPNPFRFFAELYVDFRHDIHERNKQTKEWLEYHVALLKMQQLNTDPNDPKYITTMKAIAFYEDQISKKQAKIDRYMKED